MTMSINLTFISVKKDLFLGNPYIGETSVPGTDITWISLSWCPTLSYHLDWATAPLLIYVETSYF